ncbi:hypothetical protein L484_023074 [Morus notabilis]|uniref:Uncharacterized protein n=1 Tax=Morus notabilis TaxID=981085 RepID=W9RUF3_9ROSA|nr:hypothetical protein L484_023074 [Morus notabilis]
MSLHLQLQSDDDGKEDLNHLLSAISDDVVLAIGEQLLYDILMDDDHDHDLQIEDVNREINMIQAAIIKDKYRQNLETIEHLEEVLQKLKEKRGFLLDETEREKEKNGIQAQMIAELEREEDQVPHLVALTKTRDIVLNETASHDCNVSTSYGTILDSELEKKT